MNAFIYLVACLHTVSGPVCIATKDLRPINVCEQRAEQIRDLAIVKGLSIKVGCVNTARWS